MTDENLTSSRDNEAPLDANILELFQMLDSHSSIIPESLMDYFMLRAGIECDDLRLKKLVALLGQKFITDVINDAMHYHKLRLNGGVASQTGRSSVGNKKLTLTLEDLSAALSEYGLNVRRPTYHM